jgi:hypothetical protein
VAPQTTTLCTVNALDADASFQKVTDWTNLNRRQTGLPPETELVDGVPSHLFTPLKAWIDRAMLGGKAAYWHEVQLRTGANLYWAGDDDGWLTIADAILYWYPQMQPTDRQPFGPTDWQHEIAALEQLLTIGRSVWRVNARGDGLERRVENIVTAASRQTIVAAPPLTQDHLHAAWAAIYGRAPNPDLAYDEAVRAVEDVACPLVLPQADNTRTLGTVIGALRNDVQANRPRWELVMPDKSGTPANVETLASMMALLWDGQVSRHAGSSKSRRSSRPEAATALHLAVLLVQWLSSGVLRPRQI